MSALGPSSRVTISRPLVGWNNAALVSRESSFLRARAGDGVFLFDARQQGEFAVHGGSVLAQFRDHGVAHGFLDFAVRVDAHRNPVTKHGVTDFRLQNSPDDFVLGAVGAVKNLRANVPELFVIERFRQRFLQLIAVLRSRYVLVGREVEAEDLAGGNFAGISA